MDHTSALFINLCWFSYKFLRALIPSANKVSPNESKLCTASYNDINKSGFKFVVSYII